MSTKNTLRLYVRCKRCGTLFDSGRVVVRSARSRAKLTGARHTCSHCAHEGRFSGTDYLKRKVS